MLFCPSLMCADFLNLGKEVDELCEAGADIMHLDVMDGHFVPNYSLSLGDVRAICSRSTVPCDVHLMVTNPSDACEAFIKAGASIVYVHPESDLTINSTLQKIARLGAHPGIAINPGLSFSTVEYMLPVVDYVLVMTVNPGFAGQAYLDYVTPKIVQFAEAKERFGFRLLIDGACSPEVIHQAASLGADGAVLGTSALFGKGRSYAEILAELRAENQ
jgi:ribulose-phosphate 3-epimerase